MTRLRVLHRTTYTYVDPVELGAHLLHLRPRIVPHQTLHAFAIDVGGATDPRLTHGHDHYGNPVSWLFLSGLHGALVVESRAEVEVAPRPIPDQTPAWERVAAAAVSASASEFLFASPRVPHLTQAHTWAASSLPPGRPVLAGVLDLMHRFKTEFQFDPTATTVSTSVARVLELRAGVCQDFAHVMIAGLRTHGIPARYVSGYLRTVPPPGKPRLVGADQSHAWVGVWLGPDQGWIDVDPTNQIVVQDGHVVLGWGRDYSDVSPVRGVLLGGGEHTLKVSVDIAPAPDVPLESRTGTTGGAC